MIQRHIPFDGLTDDADVWIEREGVDEIRWHVTNKKDFAVRVSGDLASGFVWFIGDVDDVGEGDIGTVTLQIIDKRKSWIGLV